MKPILKNLLLLTVILAINIHLVPTAHALSADDVCKFINNQNKSVEQQGDTKTEAPSNQFANKLVVIIEEPLGNADNKYTFKCFRKIEYTDAPADPNAKPVDGKTPPAKKTFKTTYESSCSGDTASEIADKKTKAATEKKAIDNYIICEPVMIYLSDAGTDLLYYYIGQVYRYAAGVGGLLAVLILIIAGIMRTTAGDNTNQITQANNLVTKSITGLIVLFLSAIILYTINPNFFVI